MIRSTPISSTLTSIGLFVALDIALLIYMFIHYYNTTNIPIYIYVLGSLLLFAAIAIGWKTVVGYKILEIDRDKVKVRYPLLLKSFQSPINHLDFWEETLVTTNKTKFKELKMVFKNKKVVKITLHENSNYERITKLIRNAAGNKQRKTT